MHIPDGYLSPSTCAALYAASMPFWYGSVRRLRRLVNTRLVPLLSISAAFSFVIMMFNIPLPGGTTGHATGVAISTIVLGPWGSMIAVSVALLIQALFFGDGGVTTLGANCFNMAIAGSLVAWAVNRILAGGSRATPARRVTAAAVAGYTAINVAALLTAIEFGIQPMFFRDPGGAALYAPYPLGVAIPAMMIGHLTIAGLAESLLTGGLVAYILRTDPSLIQPGTATLQEESIPARGLRPLWTGLALLMLLTPFGLLAAGTAWGEWSAQDFSQAREEIRQASLDRAAPEKPPEGLERISEIWTAPVPDYAPSFMHSRAFGYVMSAVFGSGLVILVSVLITRAAGRPQGFGNDEEKRAAAKVRRGSGFIERTIAGLFEAMEHALLAERIAGQVGLLQSLDPRVKVTALVALIVAAAISKSLPVLSVLFFSAMLLAAVSRVRLGLLLARVWSGAALFAGLIALPAIFLTPGRAVFHLPLLGWAVTAQGLTSAAFLISRVATALSFSLLLVLTTPWMHVLKALRVLRMPSIIVVILGMTYRYIFLLLQSAEDMFESRRSRIVGTLDPSERRRIAVASAGVLLGKSMQLSSEVYLAMRSRGFSGEVFTLDEFRMSARDWIALFSLLALAAAACWMGR